MTVKDLDAVKDQLEMEQVLIAKYQSYAKCCADPQLRTKCEESAAKHLCCCQALLGLLS